MQHMNQYAAVEIMIIWLIKLKNIIPKYSKLQVYSHASKYIFTFLCHSIPLSDTYINAHIAATYYIFTLHST